MSIFGIKNLEIQIGELQITGLAAIEKINDSINKQINQPTLPEFQTIKNCLKEFRAGLSSSRGLSHTALIGDLFLLDFRSAVKYIVQCDTDTLPLDFFENLKLLETNYLQIISLNTQLNSKLRKN